MQHTKQIVQTEAVTEAVVLFFVIRYSLVGTEFSKACNAAIFGVEIKIDFFPHYWEPRTIYNIP